MAPVGLYNPSMKRTFDVIVAGAGPSGLAIAGELSRRGLSVICADGAVGRPWTDNLCAWADSVEPLGFEGCFDCVYPDSRVIFDENRSRLLERRYARFDNAKLKEALPAGSVELLERDVDRAIHDTAGSEVTLDGGDKLRATVVVDATGRAHRLLSLPREADTFQNVYGILARVDSHPFAEGEMLLMDFRWEFSGGDVPPATFLYAMPHGPDYVFLEETSLAACPGVPFELLKDRLYRRLGRLGIEVKTVESVEQGSLPMNSPVPSRNNRVIGFGAAGGFVHPATGWCVAHSLRTAVPLASCIGEGIGRGLPPAMISRKAYDTIWTPELLRMRRIHLDGGKLFTRIGIWSLSLFMRAFFSAPGDMWRVYLSNDCTIAAVNRCLLGKRPAGPGSRGRGRRSGV